MKLKDKPVDARNPLDHDGREGVFYINKREFVYFFFFGFGAGSSSYSRTKIINCLFYMLFICNLPTFSLLIPLWGWLLVAGADVLVGEGVVRGGYWVGMMCVKVLRGESCSVCLEN